MKKIILFFPIFLLFSLNSLGQSNSVLVSGDWYKISTKTNGIYKLDYSSISSLGVNTDNLQIKDIKLYGNGGGMLPKLNSDFRHNDLIENAIEIHDLNNNGVFESSDFILFYGESADSWVFNPTSSSFSHQINLFSDEVFYFLTIDSQSAGKRIQEKMTLLNPTQTIKNFNDYAFHELELENLIQSGQQWFGERFDYQSSQSFNFTFPNLDQNSDVIITTEVAARSLLPSNFIITVNNTTLTSLSVPNIVSTYATEYAKIASKTTIFNSNSSSINVGLEYSSSDNGAMSWLNYIEINARRKLRMSGNSMLFRDATATNLTVGRFELENALGITVWDITNPQNVELLPVLLNEDVLSFNDSLNTIHEYIAFNSLSYLTPELKGPVANQNLHNASSDIEYVIVTHPDFLNAANRLADFHANKDNLKSLIVTPQQIYNEFSTGMQDVSAIRDFLKMLYDRSNSKLKYLLLFGDGSYDPKNRISNNTNFIPTYQSLNSTHPTLTHVTDDFFGLLDDDEGLFTDDLVDIGIGRFPVSTQLEADIIVDKIERYYAKESFGSWRNDIVFIADDGDADDGNIHMWQADSLSNYVADNYTDINIKKIYLDNYLQESTPGGPRSEATQNAINNKIDKGALLVNYTGHGGQLGWAQERILEVEQIKSWENRSLPLFMTATCKFSYFDDPDKKSAGEHVLLNANGGAIALLSTTRLVYSSPNYNLNTKFINVLFEKVKLNGEFPRLGDVFKKTKVLSGSGANNRNFTLLGDPALRLAYPEFSVNTTSISDTLKALSLVTIYGEVVDESGVLTDFNGIVFPTVLDKEITRVTLGQESCTPMPYRDQNNILYKGSASVVNGEFSFSFVVPKDIAYNYGNGKISYYAVSDDDSPVDASGSEESFIIGGTAENIDYDYDGADISLYMNTRLFVDGGITDANPVLIADISDFSGINTVGNGIGHDITAILDGNTTMPFILNEYYEAKKDDYTKGTVSFPLSGLEKGKHNITFKVWDVFNNSSERTINFVVTDEDIFTIEDYTCYPNPFSNYTEFYFQHNKANQDIQVSLNIYSVNGVLVRTIQQNYFDNGYLIGPIIWNGKDDYGGLLSAGMYISELSLNSSDGDFTSKSIRLILLP